VADSANRRQRMSIDLQYRRLRLCATVDACGEVETTISYVGQVLPSPYRTIDARGLIETSCTLDNCMCSGVTEQF
jgi:hypothetical protein